MKKSYLLLVSALMLSIFLFSFQESKTCIIMISPNPVASDGSISIEICEPGQYTFAFAQVGGKFTTKEIREAHRSSEIFKVDVSLFPKGEYSVRTTMMDSSKHPHILKDTKFIRD